MHRFIGYYEPDATSHEALDRDQAVQDEVRNVAPALSKQSASCVGVDFPRQAPTSPPRGRNR